MIGGVATVLLIRHSLAIPPTENQFSNGAGILFIMVTVVVFLPDRNSFKRFIMSIAIGLIFMIIHDLLWQKYREGESFREPFSDD